MMILSMKNKEIIKTVAFFLGFEYTEFNRIDQSHFDIGNQAETCAQLFCYKGIFTYVDYVGEQ